MMGAEPEAAVVADNVITDLATWRTTGTYFEVCNCDAICPCRRVDGRPGGRSTYGECRFALSWFIEKGKLERISLDGRSVVMAGWYDDDEPHSPWRVSLYVDDGADDQQFEALTAIFLGRVAGTPMNTFALAITAVHHVRRAHIELSHERRRWGIGVRRYVEVMATDLYDTKQAVTCGIPGHDQPGDEVVAQDFVMADDPLTWRYRGRCGFAARFDYHS
jgi:hypothetical protein